MPPFQGSLFRNCSWVIDSASGNLSFVKVTFGPINTSSADAQTVPELDTAFHGDPITDNDVIFNQNVGADIAVSSDSCFGKNDHVLPDPRPRADILCGNIRELMDGGDILVLIVHTHYLLKDYLRFEAAVTTA